ncbi:MAG: hypothetical protein KF857_12645 [Fimbriimonadaceae bacterium]|nr:hypothetical protein [Fimbriimonadaceae bacterium]
MKRSGRASIVVVGGVVGILVILFFALTSGEAPNTVANRFMSALAKGDAKTLAEASMIGDMSTADMQKAWESTLAASKHYTFIYRVILVEQPSPEQANVKVGVERNFRPGGASYEENYQLPMRKKDGKWLVEVPSIPRDMYPWLPR